VDEPEVHREPFVHLVDLSHDKVLIAWGAFWFSRGAGAAGWDIVDDQQLSTVAGRRTCIGSQADSFGSATVEIIDGDGVVARGSTDSRTWVWVSGLAPDTEYGYRVLVDGEEWAAGERWDWVPSELGGFDLAPAGRRYDLRFRTWPSPEAPTPPVRFVALGDYGVGIRSDAESSRRQRRIAEVLDRLVDDGDVRFVVSLGDNIYQGEDGRVDGESGGEDDDWYSSFFEPYRYVLARVPFFPAIGNHDTSDTEGSDDRAQLEDNFHLRERFPGESNRASV
jgi:tartrate-resistant acid phosphatase type 5